MIGFASKSRDALLREGLQAAAVSASARSAVRALVEYQERPLDFFEQVLEIPRHTIHWSLNPGYGKHRWDGTPDPLLAVLDALVRWEPVAVESGTGTGKSFELALIYLWFIGSFEGARVYTFAPKEDQLRLYSWTELRKLWPRFQRRFPTAELSDLRIRMVPGSDEWGAQGWPVQIRAGEEVSSRAAGMHAEHMLLVYEECQGMDHAVLAAGEQTCTGPHNLQLAVGNPEYQQDALHEMAEREDVVAIRVSALDHPNVVCNDPGIIPGAVSCGSIDRRRRRYGESDRRFQQKVRGISPSESKDALIRMEWINAAVVRYNDPAFREGLPARGVDVADADGGDKAAIARGIGACLLEVQKFPVGNGHDCRDASVLGSRVAVEMALESIDERHVGVDAGGVGASTVNKLRELGRLIRALNSGAKAVPTIDEDLLREKGKGLVEEELYRNLRAQMWWQLRMDLQHNRIALPDDPEMHRDLIAVEWTERLGKIQIEEKDELRKRLGRSPDKGDAVVYWNWVRHRRALPTDEEPTSAWAPEVLEHEARESRRVRTKPPPRPADIPVTALEHIP
jgi:phage terminase large subunit